MKLVSFFVSGVAVITLVGCSSHQGDQQPAERRPLAGYTGTKLRRKIAPGIPNSIAIIAEVPSKITVVRNTLKSKDPVFDLQMAIKRNSAKLSRDFEETRNLAAGNSQRYVVQLEDVKAGTFVGFITYEEALPDKSVTLFGYFENESYQVIWHGSMPSYSKDTSKSIEETVSCVLKSLTEATN